MKPCESSAFFCQAAPSKGWVKNADRACYNVLLMKRLQDGKRVHLVDEKGRQYALTLKSGETFQHSGARISHDELIGTPDGTFVQLSNGTSMLALSPTLAEYTLKMPRGAQVIYPKDLAMITIWGDVYPGARVFEAGVGSGALTIALLRAVGTRGAVVSYEVRNEFARTAMKNIERYLGPTPNFSLRLQDVYEGIDLGEQEEPQLFDRVILDLSEPWRVVPHAAKALRSGGLYLSYVPTVPQVVQTVTALEQVGGFGLIESFETLLRTWNIKGRSVRPDHRMVAHSGFITVARKIEPGLWKTATTAQEEPSSCDTGDMIMEDQDAYVKDT